LRTGGRPERDEKWKFALCRYDYSVDFEGPEMSTCAPLKSKNFADFHAFEDYATLHFVGPEKSTPPAALAGRLDKRVPLTTSRVVGSPDPPRPYQAERVYKDVPTTWPVIPHMIPGSDEMLVIALDASYGTTRIHRMKDDPQSKMWEPWLISAHTAYQLEFHPKFADNGYVYIGSNGRGPLLQPADGKREPMKTRITRLTIDRKPPHRIVPGSETTVIDWESDGHNGGAMVFGNDGMLYVTTGDGTSDSDRNLTGQDMTNLCAKVLRIDVDHPEPDEPGGAGPRKNYSVPKDNPFVDLKDARPEIWALGLRNPWRICVDKKTGHLWVGNNGQDLWEQAYLIKKGENYGWSVMEGSHEFYPSREAGPGPFIKPTVEHHHVEARSLTGGLVYYGKKYPELTGAYIYGDYSTGKIWAVKHDGEKILWHKEIADTRLTITGFGTDRQGEILIADFIKNGGLYTLVPTPPQGKSTFPRKLSDSGLFTSVKGHVLHSALIPYSVNAVLWSDGAGKQRWLGLPGNEKIEYTTSRGWNFPDKTVIVKSFYIETEEGKAESRRWIETRFLTKQGSEWFGYSYAWNDAESEGELIEAIGKDREFSIKVPPSKEYPTGVKKLNWHYPSRAECMVCHSRAANWVLGLSELQMNKDHEYDCVPAQGERGGVKGKVRENQLVVFERLGLFQVDWVKEVR
jgi:glucose/arabinose dehydrogenase